MQINNTEKEFTMKKVYLPVSVILIIFVLASAAFAINDSTSVASVNNVDPSGSFASTGVYGWCRDCSGFCSSVLINLPDCSVCHSRYMYIERRRIGM